MNTDQTKTGIATKRHKKPGGSVESRPRAYRRLAAFIRALFLRFFVAIKSRDLADLCLAVSIRG
jgi:hypothetical protein